MDDQKLLPDLFKTEYQKMIAVLCRLFGIGNIEIAQDLVSETFLTATENWRLNGIPENPKSWLYAVAKNKTRNYLKHHALFEEKLSPEIQYLTPSSTEMELDLSVKNIADSQLAMIFTICHPSIPSESQIALALNLLCGLRIEEIAAAFMISKTVIYKRISRAKEKLKELKIMIVQPTVSEIGGRLENVLLTLYLLFSEGYYSTGQDIPMRKNLCEEAMRLNRLLLDHKITNQPKVTALYALMCFHASRFDARLDQSGEIILYDDQDEPLWDEALINNGIHFLNKSGMGEQLSKYHIEAAIAYWQTIKDENSEKWNQILLLYDKLLLVYYTPIAALNRIFAFSKISGNKAAIVEAQSLHLESNFHYHLLLGYLFLEIDEDTALINLRTAHALSNSKAERKVVDNKINKILRVL